MYIADYHQHSSFSFDSTTPMEVICRQAIAKGIHEICFTEHVSLQPNDPSYGYFDDVLYSRELKRCQGLYGDKLVIKKGLEIGEPHLEPFKDELEKLYVAWNLDYVIGSVHNVQGKKLRLIMPHKTKKEIYDEYFQEVYNMVRHGDMDVIGHLDLMQRYAFDEVGNYEIGEHISCIEDILKEAMRKDIGLEINTSGLRNTVREVYPAWEVVKLYKKLGGEIITIGSDSHNAEDTSSHFGDVYKQLKDIGFTHYVTFTKRQPIWHGIDY